MPKNNKEVKEQMLKEYLSLQLIYVEFTSYIENKVKNILIENGIKFQSLSSRVKAYDSLEKKLTENMINGVHKDIKKINDLSGVRVIFYDENELKRFNRIIYAEFNVESYNPSKDIMKYDGTNITVSLKKDINKFKGLLCEIQLTTLLSHAMNEFGHDIIYKDIDELKSKDRKEYDNINNIFENVRKDVLKIMASLEFINIRVNSIKSGAKNIELLLGDDFNEKLDSVNSLNELEEIINKMIEIIPLINNDEKKYKRISNSEIVFLIVKKFSELPNETAKILSYDTYEYKYCRMLEFLKSYSYLWIDDFKSILSILYLIAIDNNIIEKFDKFLEDLIIQDKANSNRGNGNYSIHENAYLQVFDEELEEHIRIKLAEYFCDINFHYCEEVELNKIAFTRNKVNPSKDYKNKIYKVIEVILNMFLNTKSKEILKVLININYDLERNPDVFEINPIYEFFFNNYDKIDLYSKNELYKSVCVWKNIKLKDSDFYKRIKKDKTQKLYAMLFNFSIVEVSKTNYCEREEYRKNYLNEYIKNFGDDSIEEIITIIDTMNNEETSNSNLYNAGNFFINIGALEKYGKTILETKWNEFILLGVIKGNQEYKYIIDNEIKAEKITKAMIQTGYIDFSIIRDLITYSEKSKSEKLIIDIIKLILNNTNLVVIKEFKNYTLNILKEFTKSKKGIIGQVLYNGYAEKMILEKYKLTDICVLLENYRFSEINPVSGNLFFIDLFEKYPNELRNMIKQKVKDNPNYNFYNSYNCSNLTNSCNFKDERFNNLKLCIDLLQENDYYKISNYIHFIIGEYTDELGDDILKYLKENDNDENYRCVIDLCRLFDESLACWKIYEYIISKIDYEDKLLDEIDCLLFNTGVVSGEYGIANSFNDKYHFFINLKPKDEKLKSFVSKEIKRFRILYQDEKNRKDKDKIISETKYNLESESNSDD